MATALAPSLRGHFAVPDDVAYFNAAYLGPPLLAARRAAEAAIDHMSRPWEVPPEEFFSLPERARGAFARLIGADADGVAIVPAVSYGIALAAANVPLRRGGSVLVLDEQFPSNVYAWREAARAAGASIVTVPRPSDDDWTSAVLEHLVEGVDVAALPNCHWTDGTLIDLEAVAERTRELGAALVLDVTQSLGARPLDVARIRPDYLVCASYKWLLGPYGASFTYAAPERRDGRPLEHPWTGREGSEDFAGLVDYVDAFQPGARRYDAGQRAGFTLLPVALAAIEQLLAWTVEDVHARLRALTDAIESAAHARGLGTAPRERRAGHMIGLRLPEGASRTVASRLAASNVFASQRGSSLRVAPHVHCDGADVERLFAALDEVLDG